MSLAGTRTVYAQTSSDWHAIDMCIGNFNHPSLLWTHPNGQAVVWITDPGTGGVASYATLAPPSGYTAIALSQGGDVQNRVLWRNPNGHITISRVNSGGVTELTTDFAPPTDTTGLTWTAADIDTNNANKTYVLWQRSDGLVCVWRLTVDLAYEAEFRSSPSSGAVAQHIAADDAGKVRVELLLNDGTVSYWTVNTSLALESSALFNAPSAGFAPFGLASHDDGTSWLGWGSASSTANLWSISANGVKQGESTHNPPAATGWKPLAVGVTSDGRPNTMWSAINGEAQNWNHAANGTVQGVFRYNVVPANLTATGGPGYIDLSWDGSGIHGAFAMYRSTSSNSGYNYIGTAFDPSYRDTNVTVGTPYYYRITAYGGNIESGASATKNATPAALPALDASINTGQGTSWVGIGTRNSTGDNQGVYHWIEGGMTASYQVNVKCGSSQSPMHLSVPNYSAIMGTTGSARFYVGTGAQRTEITNDILSASGWMTSDSEVTVTVEVTANPGTPWGTQYILPIRVQDNGNPAAVDEVETITIVVQDAPTTEPTAGSDGLDARINGGTGTSWVGGGTRNNFYEGQSTYTYADSGGVATFLVSVKCGTSTHPIHLTLPHYDQITTPGGTARFFLDATNQEITSQITSSAGYTQTGTDDEIVVRVKITVGAQVPHGTTIILHVHAQDDSTPGMVDTVRGYLIVSPTTPTPTPSPATVRLNGTPGDTTATLNWIYLPQPSDPPLTGFKFFGSDTSGGPYTDLHITLSNTASVCTLTSLTNGVTYYYRVLPTFANSTGTYSNEVAITPRRAQPTSGIVLQGGAAHQKVGLWWNASARADQYAIWRRVENGTWSQIDTISATANPTYSDTGLTDGTTYSYRVNAMNEGGVSESSNTVVLRPGPLAPLAPDAPTLSAIDTNAGSIQVTPPALPVGAVSLNLYMGLSADVAQMNTPIAMNVTNQTPITVSGLSPGHIYAFRAEAVNSYGATSSPIASVQYGLSVGPDHTGPPDTPAAPVIGQISYAPVQGGGPTPLGPPGQPAPTNGAHTIRIWGAFPPGADSLSVQWKQQGDADTVFTSSGHELNLSIYYDGYYHTGYVDVQPLQALTTYVFRLKATNSNGSAIGPTASATTLPDPPAQPPAPNITATTSHSVTLDVPPLPTGATSLTLYYGRGQLMIMQDGSVCATGNGGSGTISPATSLKVGNRTSLTIDGFQGGAYLSFEWMASNGSSRTFGNSTSVTLPGSGLQAPDAPAFLNVWQNNLEVITPGNLQDLNGTYGYGNASYQAKLLLQVKPTGADDTAYQALRFAWGDGITTDGNPQHGDEHRESNSAGDTLIYGHSELSPLHPARRLLVNDLTPGQGYTFRFGAYLASDPQGTVVFGAPASIVLPTETRTWAPGPAIECAGIRYPWNSMTASSGHTYRLNSFAAADWDVLTHNVNGFVYSQFVTSPCRYAWGADDGDFPEGSFGSTVMWQAPQVTTPTWVTIMMNVNDVDNGNVGRGEAGARDDAMIAANDRPLQFKVSILVNP